LPINAIDEVVHKTLATPAVSEKLLASGALPSASTPRELAALLKRDTEKRSKLVKAQKITPEG